MATETTGDVTLTRAEATYAYWQIAPQYDESGPPPDERWATVMTKLRPPEAEVAVVYAAKAAGQAPDGDAQAAVKTVERLLADARGNGAAPPH